MVVDIQQLAEYRYRAVREVLGGSPIGEVAARYGTSRQTLHTWRRRFENEGMPGLLDRSRRPRNSPTRLSAEVEAEICGLRRRHPRWGARRIAHELVGRGLEASRAACPHPPERGRNTVTSSPGRPTPGSLSTREGSQRERPAVGHARVVDVLIHPRGFATSSSETGSLLPCQV